MKIFTAEQIRDWDKFTIENEPIRSLDLMERAASRCTHWIRKNYSQDTGMVFMCGPGNNGGDGLVVARQLHEMFYKVSCYHINFSGQTSEDFNQNKQRLNRIGLELNEINSKEDLQKIKSNEYSLVVDAIFGFGLNRPAQDLPLEVIKWINHSGLEVISIDIPSGMFSEDNKENSKDGIVKADATLTLQSCKLSFLLPDFGGYVGRIHVLPIGLSGKYYELTDSKYELVTQNEVLAIIKKRHKYSHKGLFGHAYILAGAKGKMGAAVLATRSCVRGGAGLTTAHVPRSAWQLMQQAVPEAMLTFSEADDILCGALMPTKKTVGVGPGIGQEAQTAEFVFKLIAEQDEPMVIDADALNILAGNKERQREIPERSILTPHPKEFQRWVGEWHNEGHKLNLLLELSQRLKLIVVLKGAHTITATPEGKLYFNTTGNPGLATPGSGDVLTGLITSLLAQGYSPRDAAVLGVWVHGAAGDKAQKQIGEQALRAGDLIEAIPLVMKEHEQTVAQGG